ncbi:MAG: hypothetical protein KF716_05570 [Anaerolineae bacterium]|nr:hypothetical protein [Anaerolineae bacterium]
MRRLFISNSNQPHGLRAVIVTLLALVLVIVVVDRAVGVIVPRIAMEPPFILRQQNVPGVERLWAFEDAGVAPVVFTGSSQGHMAFSPHVFNDRVAALTGHAIQSVNVSVWGSVTTIQRDLIRNLLLPTHPKIILYAIEMRAALPAAQHGLAVDDFRNKPLGYALTVSSPIERNVLLWLLRHSNLVSYRDNLRDWLTGTRAIDDVGYSMSVVDDLGYFRDPTIYNRDPTVIQTQFVPFTMDDATRQLFVDIKTSCDQASVPCILLNLPLHEQSYQYISAGDEAVYQATLHGSGLAIWDFNTKECRAALGDASFFNLNHLNASGAEKLSAWVADVYIHRQMGQPAVGDPSCAQFSDPPTE